MVIRLVIVYSLYDNIFKNRAKPPGPALDPGHASPNGLQGTVNEPLQQLNRGIPLFFIENRIALTRNPVTFQPVRKPLVLQRHRYKIFIFLRKKRH